MEAFFEGRIIRRYPHSQCGKGYGSDCQGDVAEGQVIVTLPVNKLISGVYRDSLEHWILQLEKKKAVEKKRLSD